MLFQIVFKFHFLLFSASIAFMIWSFTQHRMKTCITVRVRSSVNFVHSNRNTENDDKYALYNKYCLACRTGGSCGWMMPSGTSCSPSFCVSSWSCGDLRPTTRGNRCHYSSCQVFDSCSLH